VRRPGGGGGGGGSLRVGWHAGTAVDDGRRMMRRFPRGEIHPHRILRLLLRLLCRVLFFLVLFPPSVILFLSVG
jgi:hypothetical protein